MRLDWPKILMAFVSALVVALQSINLGQGVAISGTQHRVEAAEDRIENLQAELLRRIETNQKLYMNDFHDMKAKIDHIDDSIGKK